MKERPASSNQLEPRFDEDGVQSASGLDAQGRELPDPVAMAPPVGYSPPSQLEALIESVLRRRDFVEALQKGEFETVEEADDFEVDEDYDPRFEPTIYEEYFAAKSSRAASDASQRTSRTAGAGAGEGDGKAAQSASPPPSSATSEAPKVKEPPSNRQTE